MPLSPRHPVIVGAAQTTQRVADPHDALDPIGMMETALRRAAEDTGATALLPAIDKIYIPRGTWRYGNPGALLGERIGAPRAQQAIGIISGHIVQVMVDQACAEIASGQHDVIAIVGGESENSRRKLAKTAPDAIWNDRIEGSPDSEIGSYGTSPIFDLERKAGVLRPSASFALCETSLRYALGETPRQHRERISEISASLSRVAEANPHAWLPEAVSAEAIRTPTATNRMVNYPYTKLMTSNISVDQSAALLICSTEAARRFGIPDAKRVFLRAAVEMSHVTQLSERLELHHHPGMDAAAARLLALTGVAPEALRHIDLYSCFPFAVQAGARALGLDQNRPLSVTGGLTFSGGPFGSYVVHALARMVELLREAPGDTGLVGSVGGTFQKFAYATYSTDPGDGGLPCVEDVSPACAAMPTRPWIANYEGKATTESYTVHVTSEGPRFATFSALTQAGERVWGTNDDPALMASLLDDEEGCGHPARLSSGQIVLQA